VKIKVKNIGTVWVLVIVLFACAAASTIALLSRINVFLKDDSGAIPLIPETSASDTVTDVVTAPPFTHETIGGENAVLEETDIPLPPADTVVLDPADTQSPNPGFEVSDEQTVWTTYTQVEIFRTYYENGERVITVRSDDGDKLIAPGTENSYTFKLSNTGNLALDYTVEVDAYFTPADIYIPITGRLTRYDGKNIVGPNGEFVDVPTLDTAEDSATLAAGRYTYYTLDWLWPFESGDDELDTMLGNLALEQDLTFTIVIKTTAEIDTDNSGNGGSGILPPQTGDGVELVPIALTGGAAFALMLFFMLSPKCREEKNAD